HNPERQSGVYRIHVQALEWRVFIATVRAAHPDKDAASEILNLRQDGSPTGQRQLAGSVHDSRVPTGTTPGSVFI
ncbi:TPA: hypothetical protein ACXL4G_006876, partial [Klebsiella michiganensis]